MSVIPLSISAILESPALELESSLLDEESSLELLGALLELLVVELVDDDVEELEVLAVEEPELLVA